jgi:hypothetical protein
VIAFFFKNWRRCNRSYYSLIFLLCICNRGFRRQWSGRSNGWPFIFMWSSFLPFVNFMRNLLGFRFIRSSSDHAINIVMIIPSPVIFRLSLFSLFKFLGLGLGIFSSLDDMFAFTSSLLYGGGNSWDVLHLDDGVLVLWLISFSFFGHIFFVFGVFQLLVTCCYFGGV